MNTLTYFYLNTYKKLTRTLPHLCCMYSPLPSISCKYISMQYTYILHCCVKMYKGQESDNVKSSIIGYFDFLPLLIKRFQISIRDSWLINESFNVFTEFDWRIVCLYKFIHFDVFVDNNFSNMGLESKSILILIF